MAKKQGTARDGKKAANKPKRGPRGAFLPGNREGAAGRPQGSRNRTTQMAAQVDSQRVAHMVTALNTANETFARQLDLMRGTEVIRSFRISLGLMPEGHKERAGDFRTPEGRYLLTRRNARSDYFLSIQVSYPNAEDLLRAQRNRWVAGGSIMVHGLPNSLRHSPDYYASTDWTDGCIALSNSDMVEFWLLSPDNMTIEITP